MFAVRIEGLSKVYRVNHAEPRRRRGYKTFREDLMRLAGMPLKRLRRIADVRRARAGGRARATDEDFRALDNVSFDVQPGEVVGIIGRNGAGKSTLLKVLSRITPPTSGRVMIHGRVGSLLEVGTGFHPELTGRENVYMNGSILGMSRREIRQKFDQIVDFSGVERFLDTPVKRYSSGMQVRLAFAVAAHLDPEILLIDEVLAVGDFEFQRRCLGKMDEVARSGRTILFVSHNMAAVEGLCTHGVILDRGRVIFQGPQSGAIQHYLRMAEEGANQGRYVAPEGEATSSHRPRIVHAEILSGGRFSGEGYPVGSDIEFRVRCRSEKPLHRPGLAVAVNTLMGERITTLHSEVCGGPNMPQSLVGEWVFRCRVGGLPLAPGDYQIRLALRERGSAAEIIDDAMLLTILPGDFLQNGGKLTRGMLLCRQEWLCETNV